MMEPLCYLVGIRPSRLSKIENIFLEADLFVRICDELFEIFKTQHKEYFRLIPFSKEKEETILQSNFSYSIINDILLTKDYTLSGIAYYIHLEEEKLFKLMILHQTDLSVYYLRKIIELHRSVRVPLYHQIMQNIFEKCSTLSVKK